MSNVLNVAPDPLEFPTRINSRLVDDLGLLNPRLNLILVDCCQSELTRIKPPIEGTLSEDCELTESDDEKGELVEKVAGLEHVACDASEHLEELCSSSWIHTTRNPMLDQPHRVHYSVGRCRHHLRIAVPQVGALQPRSLRSHHRSFPLRLWPSSRKGL